MQKQMKGLGMKRCLTLLAAALMVHVASAQYVPAMSLDKKAKVPEKAGYWHRGNMFQHLDVALSLGITGIGIEVASPICEIAQVRLGYEFMPHFRKSLTADLMIGSEECLQYDQNGDRIETNYDKVREMMYEETGYDMASYFDMTSRITMNNFKLLVDIFPLSDNKKLHATVGFYWGPSEVSSIESNSSSYATLYCVSAYNKKFEAASAEDEIKSYGSAGFKMGKYSSGSQYKMTPGDNGYITIPVKTNSFKPYIGVGYEAAFSKKRDDLKFAVTGGVMFWGGTPTMITPDYVNLTEDVDDVPGKIGSYVNFVSFLKVCPTVSFRFIKNIF